MTVKYKAEKILQDHLWNLQNGQKILVNDRILEAISKERDALEEVKQYREIGTVEECREAVEKQTPKKPIPLIDQTFGRIYSFMCPYCNYEGLGNNEYRFARCENCGQKLSWESDEA